MKHPMREKNINAIRRFRGCAVRGEHIPEKRFASGFTFIGGLFSAKDNASSVEDAVRCGKCQLQYERSAG
uniref:Uncharacterized protein n=1 Tax=Candidatus Kentrum sp. SD TaxID=2126332 RepID=A0A450Y716_9GAMM|nr:MAG: hypothetical protein BECKSD772F_GA0070984_10142 [Candidatus Kentron sp. SD]VFK49274.1 MAG: hypothetical protein BECKSD772E_GA0070983_11692 [Candidatus Kentron sp. SD]